MGRRLALAVLLVTLIVTVGTLALLLGAIR
jgi:hypothetical protein